MTMTSESERAIKVGFSTSDFFQKAGFAKTRRKPGGGSHRTDGMRTRWPDADFEDFEEAGFHATATQLQCYADLR